MAYASEARWEDVESLVKESLPNICLSKEYCFRLSDDERVVLFALNDISRIEDSKEELSRYLDKAYEGKHYPLAVQAYANEVFSRRTRRIEQPVEAFPGDTRLSPLDSIAPLATEFIELPELPPLTIEEIMREQEAYEKRQREAVELIQEEHREMLEKVEKERLRREAEKLTPEQLITRREIQEERKAAAETIRNLWDKIEKRWERGEERMIKERIEAAKAAKARRREELLRT